MPALDTIASYQGTVNSALAAGVMAAGDSATIRNYAQGGRAGILAAMYDDVTSPQPWRVRSPLLADNVNGIQFYPGATTPSELWPVGAMQPLMAQDTLTFELSTAATTGKALGALLIYYSNLPGATARLYGQGDIGPLITDVKPVNVAIGSGANTAGAWYDLVLNTTENLLDANTDYAVLGISFDQAVAALAIRGADTGNLRCGIPGGVNNPYSARYFWRLSGEYGLPTIPVINSANVGNTYVSLISSSATGAAGHVVVYLAQLAQRLS